MRPPIEPQALAGPLREHFGHLALRPGQGRAVTAALAGDDVLVVMPTGAGKSLCFTLPAVVAAGLTVVVSPLVALMNDQVAALRARGIPAAAVHGLRDPGAGAADVRAAVQGRLRLLYVSPERLAAPALQAALRRAPLVRVVVDEAHCLLQWGHDFRPDYLALRAVLEAVGRPPITALTATATRAEQAEILRLLGRPSARRVVTGFDRPEIHHAVLPAASPGAKARALVALLGHRPGPALVYTGTRAEAEQVARGLAGRSVAAAAYHAGQAGPLRRATQEAFMADRVRVVAATSAFGLGVDKPDVRAVVHWGLPFDLTAYVQAAGRAGRDGLPALSLLLAGPDDRRLRLWQLAAAVPTGTELAALFLAFVAEGADGPAVDEAALAARAGVPPGRARAGLAGLARRGIVRRIGGAGAWAVVRAPRRGELDGLVSEAAARAAVRRANLDAMTSYATSGACRRATILSHFGDRVPAPRPDCCDVCAGLAGGWSAGPAFEADGAAGGGESSAGPVFEAGGGPHVTRPADDLEARVLAAILPRDGRYTVRGLASALRSAGGAAGAGQAEVRAAVDRLVASGALVVHHGDGRARLALTRGGHARARARRVAEASTPYRFAAA